jgi:hypothetical protein
VYRIGHPQEKQRDESKSPTFKIKLWDTKITAKTATQIRQDSLLVNVNTAIDPHSEVSDAERYLQMIYTKIYDLRTNPMSDAYITKESVLEEFLYSAGDSGKGKPQCTLLATVTVLAPSWYWEAKRGASIQFKASSMEIFKKTLLRRANTRTPEKKIDRFQKARLAVQRYGLDRDDVEDNVFDDASGQPGEPSTGTTAGNNTNTGSNPGLGSVLSQAGSAPKRQLNASAIISSRIKTTSVCVMPNGSSRTNGGPLGNHSRNGGARTLSLALELDHNAGKDDRPSSEREPSPQSYYSDEYDYDGGVKASPDLFENIEKDKNLGTQTIEDSQMSELSEQIEEKAQSGGGSRKRGSHHPHATHHSTREGPNKRTKH